MAGLVPAIHVFAARKTWMPGTRPGMTESALPRQPDAPRELGRGAPKRLETEANLVRARRQRDGAEDHVGAQDVDRLAVERRAPPRMPHVGEQQEAAVRRVDGDVDPGIGVAQDARGAGAAPHAERDTLRR